MNQPGIPNFDQIRVFLTVIDTGSFAAAGRKLGRATSVISYAISNLEQQLGVELFDREHTRKPELTPAGRSVLAEARIAGGAIDSLRAKVKGILNGLEKQLTIAVDVMFPVERLVDAVRAFEETFPTVPLRLNLEALGAITESVENGTADLGIDGPVAFHMPGLEQILLGGVEMLPVAAPTHPLALCEKNSPGAAKGHVQLVLSDRSELTKGHDFGVVGVKSWRLTDLSTKKALLIAGVGWGNMPVTMIRSELECGTLKIIQLPDWNAGFYPFRATYRSDNPIGPAAQWLLQRLISQSSAWCRESENAGFALRPRDVHFNSLVASNT